jgi:serine/threonine-protein kinase
VPLSIGQVLQERYRIDALLGQGGMGAVYRATDLRFDSPVALKENHMLSPESQRQFARGAKILYPLRHPNLPRVIDHFIVPGQGQYLVMEFIPGDDLSQMLKRRGPPAEARALDCMSQALDALEYLHTSGIIHRDVKPANVIVTPEGQIFLVDFGLAKEYDPVKPTTLGAWGVTPGFSPLEQYGEGMTDARSDVYAAGATLYALLTGQTPPGAPELAGGTAHLVPPSQINPRISPGVERATLRAMQFRPADRFQTAAGFRAALLPPPAPRPVFQPKPSPAQSTPQPATPETTRRRRIPTAVLAAGAVTLFLFLVLAFIVRPLVGPDPTPGPPTSTFAMPTTAPTTASAASAPTALAATSTVAPPPTSTSRPMATPTTQPTKPPPTATRAAPKAGSVKTRKKDGMKVVYVPAGEFLMGSTEADSEAAEDEKPQHTVHLDAFWIDKTEVSNAQYRQCVEAATCRAPTTCDWEEPTNDDGSKTDHPVVCVSWHDAQAYCQWAGARLPTEAEWEKAARGSGGPIYPWGYDFDCSKGNFDDETQYDDYVVPGGEGCDGYVRTAPVGSFPAGASPYGVLDMAGNVWEWVADWYDADYYGASPARNPPGPDAGEYRVLRGGSWYPRSGYARAANRGNGNPDYRVTYIGFRCGVSPTSSP